MTTSPLVNGTRVASIALATLLTTAVATALLGAVIGGLGGAGTAAGAPDLRAAAAAGVAGPGNPAPGSSTLAGTPTAAVTPAPVAAPTPRPLPFDWSVHRITAAGLGASWRSGCPVGPASLRAVSFTHWDFEGAPSTGKIILHKDVVKRARTVFRSMYLRRFPLRLVQPVSAYGGSDDDSMAADNTSAFNCRKAVAAGRPTWSRHAYGKAIDVNPVENPYLFRGDVLPPAGAAHTRRSKAAPGLIRRGDHVHDAFRAAGFRWGGSFTNPDYQHFER